MSRPLLVMFVLGALLFSPIARSPNDQSRICTIQSLVERHTLIIDETVYVDTIDKVRINGHFYSDKPPVAAVLGAIVYYPLYHLGIRIKRNGVPGEGWRRWNLAYYLITLFTVKLLWLASALA
ncbi:MAG: hypothetical protein ACYTFT_12635, partial [Planctomycetota bacterium]